MLYWNLYTMIKNNQTEQNSRFYIYPIYILRIIILLRRKNQKNNWLILLKRFILEIECNLILKLWIICDVWMKVWFIYEDANIV